MISMRFFKQIITGSLLLTSLSIANNAMAQKENTLTNKEKKQGWQLLFDGSTTNGWHSYNSSTLGSAWNAEGGTLHFSKTDQNKTGGDAVTNEVFGDFELSLDWKIAKGGNSGIMFLVQEDPKYRYAYYTGPEMQVLDNDGHKDAKIIKHRAGDLYDLITSTPETVKPAGEWNSVKIKLKDTKLDFWLNGTKVLSTTLWDDAWNKLVAGSKFKGLPDFAKFRSGHIVLQDHGDEVWYKNIKLRKL